MIDIQSITIHLNKFGERERARDKNEDPHDDKETKMRRLKVPGTPVR